MLMAVPLLCAPLLLFSCKVPLRTYLLLALCAVLRRLMAWLVLLLAFLVPLPFSAIPMPFLRMVVGSLLLLLFLLGRFVRVDAVRTLP